MQNTKKAPPKVGAKKLVLARETLRTLTPHRLQDVRGGLLMTSFCRTYACIIITAPETFDGPDCKGGTF